MSRIWSSLGSTDMNDSSNYSSTGSLLTTDDLVFNGTSTVDATATADLDVGSVAISNLYTGSWTISGRVLTVEDSTGFTDMCYTATGPHNYGNGITLNGTSAVIDISSNTGGAITASSCIVTYNGATPKINCRRNVYFKQLVLAASTHLTVTGGTGQAFGDLSGVCLIMGASSTITINTTTSIALNPHTATTNIMTLGAGYTIDGAGDLKFFVGKASATLWVPGFTYSGTGVVYFIDYGYPSSTWLMKGDLVASTGTVELRTSIASETQTLDLNDFNLTCNQFNLTPSYSDTARCIMYWKAGTHSIGSHNISSTTGYVTEYLGTGTINCSGNWTNSSHASSTTSAQSSSVIFIGTGASAVTSNNKSFYDVTVNNASKAFSFSDTPSLHNLTTTTMASYTHTGFVLTSSSNVTFNGAGTLNLGNGITMTGNTGTLTIGSTVGVVTASNCALIFNGTTGCALTDNKGVTFNTLTLGSSAVLQTNGSSITTLFSSSTTPFILGSNSSFTNNTKISFQASGSCDIITQGSGATWATTNTILLSIGTSNINVTLPALTITGTNRIFQISDLVGGGITTLSTFTLTGNLNIGSNNFYFYQYGATSKITLNFSSYNLTCANFYPGGVALTSGTMTINYGSGTITVSSYSAATYNNVMTENFMTSNWTCSGNWAFGSSHTVSHQMDILTLTNTSDMTSNGKNFNYLQLNASGKTIKMADNLKCHGYNKIAGTLNTNSKILTITGDCIEVTDIQEM